MNLMTTDIIGYLKMKISYLRNRGLDTTTYMKTTYKCYVNIAILLNRITKNGRRPKKVEAVTLGTIEAVTDGSIEAMNLGI